MMNDADHGESFSHRYELISTLLRLMDPKCLTETELKFRKNEKPMYVTKLK